jgi:Predicted Zn-dependent protease (DUF2268)
VRHRCGNGVQRQQHHAEPSHGGKPATHEAMTEHLVNGRFTVTMSGEARQEARAAGDNLPALIVHTLAHINALLPGPHSTITVSYARGSDLITQAGVYGFTNPLTVRIRTGFGPTSQVTTREALRLWFPRALAHEVNHAARMLKGPGFGPTLLPQLISEGIATAFDQAAFPGPVNPWTHAITPAQECALWKEAKPQLGYTGLYDAWMFGYKPLRIPNWTGFTIGYHIVYDYRRHHPRVSWETLTLTSAATILAGSRYQPCPQ